MEVPSSPVYHCLDDEDHTSFASCMYDLDSAYARYTLDVMPDEGDELEDSNSIQVPSFLSGGVDEDESFLRQFTEDMNQTSSFLTANPGMEVVGKEDAEECNCAALKVLVKELQNQFGVMQGKLSQMEISVATMPTSQVEVLQTMVEHQATQIQTLQQEKEVIRRQLNELEVKVRAPNTIQDPQDSSSRGGYGGAYESDEDEDNTFDICSIYSNDQLDMSLMSELGTSLMKGSSFESPHALAKGGKGIKSSSMNYSQTCSTTVETASQSEYTKLNQRRHHGDHDVLLGRRTQGEDLLQLSLDHHDVGTYYNSSILQGHSSRSNFSKTHSLPMTMSVPSQGKHVRRRLRSFAAQPAQEVSQVVHRSSKNIVIDPLLGSVSGESGMRQQRPSSPSQYLAAARDRLMHQPRRRQQHLHYPQAQQSSEQRIVLESNRIILDTTSEQGLTRNHFLEPTWEEAITVEKDDKMVDEARLSLENLVAMFDGKRPPSPPSLDKKSSRTDANNDKFVNSAALNEEIVRTKSDLGEPQVRSGASDPFFGKLPVRSSTPCEDGEMDASIASIQEVTNDIAVEEAVDSLVKPDSTMEDDKEVTMDSAVEEAVGSPVKTSPTLEDKKEVTIDSLVEEPVDSLVKPGLTLEDCSEDDKELSADSAVEESGDGLIKQVSTLEHGSNSILVKKSSRRNKSKSRHISLHHEHNSAGWKAFNVRIFL